MSSPRRPVDLLVLAHSAVGFERAGRLFDGWEATELVACGPGVDGVARGLTALLRHRPKSLYLVDIGASTTVAAVMGRLCRKAVVLDTGDLVFALERSRGVRGPLGLVIVWVGEQLALACSSRTVVRGTRHKDFLGGQPVFAPDLPPSQARPRSGDGVRRRLGLEGAFVVGLVGTIQRAPRLRRTYGWELVEALALSPPEIKGLVVGDGDGLHELKARAQHLGVAERVTFAGRVPTHDVADYIGAMDVALSTQSNDAIGAVRTTGKLPLYLACGVPVLASDVGEARRLLRHLGWTLPYEGAVDNEYPRRLAVTLRDWSQDARAMEERRRQALGVAAEAFDPETVRGHVRQAVAPYLSAA